MCAFTLIILGASIVYMLRVLCLSNAYLVGLILFVLAAGFIHPWVIGGYWALPLQYIQNGIAINEFTGGAVLCCAVLCCAVLCCAVLCCAVLCCAVLCCAVTCSFGFLRAV